jgi:demethylmenaquinone methyltransferase / 2-methoxy-6-polyprenyl-1,4-benzoquinol methylase
MSEKRLTLTLGILGLFITLAISYISRSTVIRNTVIKGGSGEMFDSIASIYDLGNSIISGGMHHTWKTDLLYSMSLSAQSRLLDIATGTGDVAILAHTTLGLHDVTGIDPSKEMIAIASKKIASLGITDSVIRVSHGDAQYMPDFSDSSYDAVTVSFGIRNIPDRSAALREIYRVLKVGGVCGILELTPPNESLLGLLAGMFTRYIVPAIGSILGSTGREYEYLQDSVFLFPTNFEEELESAHLRVGNIREYLGGIIKIYVAKKI